MRAFALAAYVALLLREYSENQAPRGGGSFDHAQLAHVEDDTCPPRLEQKGLRFGVLNSSIPRAAGQLSIRNHI
jgi:hypothetical protein